MPVDKLSIEQFAQRIKEKYPDYKDVPDTDLVNRIISKHPEYKDRVNIGVPVSRPSQSGTTTQAPNAPTNQPAWPSVDQTLWGPINEQVAQQHSNEVAGATQRIQNEFQNTTPAIQSIIKQTKQQKELADVQSSLHQRGMDFAGANDITKRVEHLLPKHIITATDDEVNAMKSDMQNNPDIARDVMHEHAKLNPDKSNQIKSDMYLIDSQDRKANAGKILSNSEDIKSGKLDYSIWHGGKVLQPQSFLQSVGSGFKDRTDQIEGYDRLSHAKPEDAINELEGKRNAHTEDDPIPVPGTTGGLIGREGLLMAKGSGAAIGVGSIPGAEGAAPWAAALATSPELYKRGWYGSFTNNYNELRDKGTDPQKAYTEAKNRADFDAKVDVAQGALVSGLGAKIGLPGGSTKVAPGLLNASKDLLVQVAKSTPEALAVAGTAGGAQMIKNLHSGKPIDEGVADNVVAQLGLHYATAVATKGVGVVTGKLHQMALKTLKEAPDQAVHQTAGEQVESGSLTPEQADAVSASKTEQSQQQTDLMDQAKEAAKKAKGIDGQRLRDLSIADPEAFDAKLKDISEKAHDPKQHEATAEKYGQEVVNIATQLHPKTEPDNIPEQVKTNENESKTEGQAQAGQAENVEPSGEGKGYAVVRNVRLKNQPESPLLESRHADTPHDEQGIVSGPNDKPLSVNGRRDANDLANDVADKGVTKIISSDLERAKETADAVAQKTGAQVENRPNLRTWDIGEFDGTKDADFKHVQKYFVDHPDATEFEGKKIAESFNQYKDRIIKARTELENEPASTMLINHSNNMMLWDAYVKNGREWNTKTANDYLNAEKPEPATLTTKNNTNALPVQEPNAVGLREQGAVRGTVGEGNHQPENIAGESQPIQDGQSTDKEGGQKVGVSHEALKSLSKKIGLKEPERGTILSPREYADRGRALIDAGADPEVVAQEFKDNGRVSPDIISVARAHMEDLTKEVNSAGDKFGDKSEQYNTAKAEFQKWQDEVMKPMGTKAGETFTSLQGERDLDSGSFTSIKRAVEDKTGQPITADQETKAKELSGKVQELTEKNQQLVKELQDIHDKVGETNKVKSSTEKAKALADKLRKAKLSRPGMFSAATPASLVWDGAVEATAKAIEVGGKLADAIQKGIELIKDSDWYKGLPADQQKQAEKEFTDWHEEQGEEKTPEQKATERAIAAKKKSIQTLKDKIEGNKKEKNPSLVDKDNEELKKLQEEQDELSGKLKDQNDRAREIVNKAKLDKKTQDKEQERQDKLAELANKSGNDFTNEEVNMIWNHVKDNYIDKGEDDFALMINNAAKDLGLSTEQVVKAITMPKGAKKITDEMYKIMGDRRLAVQRAELWVKTANTPKSVKFFKAIPNAFFALTTFGHGTVGAITHAGMDLYRPTNWSKYFPFVLNQFKYAFGNISKYEQAMSDLVNDQDFSFWKRAGLVIDPRKLSGDDYQGWTKIFGKVGMVGERGFNALKIYRLEQAKDIYSKLSNEEKADPEMAKTVAKMVNLSTGTTDVNMPGAASVIFFAPKLELSKWQRIWQEPAKAVITLANWGTADPHAKVAAKMVARHAGEMVATMAGLLAANQGILSLSGSTQKINWTQPLESDWMKFKFGGMQLDASGGMISTLKFLGSLGEEGIKTIFATDEEMKGKKPGEVEGAKVLQLLKGKLSPFAGTASEVLSGTDYNNRPLPWSKVPPKKGDEKHTVLSYAMSKMPIPLAEGFKTVAEGMKNKGMSEPDIKEILLGILVGGVSGGTGARLTPDYSLDKPAPKSTGMGKRRGHKERRR